MVMMFVYLENTIISRSIGVVIGCPSVVAGFILRNSVQYKNINQWKILTFARHTQLPTVALANPCLFTSSLANSHLSKTLPEKIVMRQKTFLIPTMTNCQQETQNNKCLHDELFKHFDQLFSFIQNLIFKILYYLFADMKKDALHKSTSNWNIFFLHTPNTSYQINW